MFWELTKVTGTDEGYGKVPLRYHPSFDLQLLTVCNIFASGFCGVETAENFPAGDQALPTMALYDLGYCHWAKTESSAVRIIQKRWLDRSLGELHHCPLVCISTSSCSNYAFARADSECVCTELNRFNDIYI